MPKTKSKYICKNCSKEFNGWTGNPNKYCSKDCYDKSQVKHDKLDCIQCGSEISRKKTGHFLRNKKYKEKKGKKVYGPFCSNECRQEYDKVPKVLIYCKFCESEFKERRWQYENHGRGKFCSKECQYKFNTLKRCQKKCKRCYRQFGFLPNQKSEREFCSKSCAQVFMNRGKDPLTHEEYFRAYSKFNYRRGWRNLTESYLKNTIVSRKHSPKRKNIPKTVLNAYKAFIQSKRQLKQRKNGKHTATSK